MTSLISSPIRPSICIWIFTAARIQLAICLSIARSGCAVATGDASHGWLPNIGDGYPRLWPGTIDAVARDNFKYLLGGHGPMQSDRTVMTSQRNYIEELTEKVEAAKKEGLSLKEMQARLTVASLKSMQSNSYQAFLERTLGASHPHFGPMPPLQNDVNANIADVYKNLDRV